MYNKIILLGRIACDLVIKTTPAGVAVLSFSIAVDRRYQPKSEEKKADFFNCVAWRNEAEFIARCWTKGKPILIEGELQNRSYTDKNGETKWMTEIAVERASFCGDAKGSAAKTDGSGLKPNITVVDEPTLADFENVKDDDYPF